MKFEEFDFIGGHEKKLNYKHIAFVAISILIIIISIVLLASGSSKNDNIQYSNMSQENQIINENNLDDQQEETKKQEIKLPIYSQEAKEEITHIYKSEEKRVFLTFDDGPSNTVTPLILEILKKNNIKATFFVLGSRVELYPEILKQAYNEGHYIANHGYSHNYKEIYAKAENVISEFNQTESCIRDALEIPEYSSHLFRFPGGSAGGKYSSIKKQAIDILNENDISYVDWNALNKDAEGSFDKNQLYSNLVETANNKKSIVVLMHDAGNKKSTAESLQDIINYFVENEYEFKNFYDIMK